MLPQMRSVLFAFTLTAALVATAGAGSSQAPAPAAPAAAAPAAATEATPVTEATIVYLANVGSRYHTKECKYLKKSGKAVTILAAMKQGFAPCNQCKAPKLKRE